MTEIVLNAKGVFKDYGRAAVLLGVDLEVPRGTVIGLLGKNGAGKTTLLQCALGLLRVDGGELTLFGEKSWRLSARAKERLGYVPQTPHFSDWMRVEQVIDHTAAFYERWNHGLVDRLINSWGLSTSARAAELSGGQQRQLAILLALAHEPEFLVFDEPVAHLDPAARREFLQELIEIALEGDRTILFSTHITSDLERVADRVALLQNHKIRFSEELDALKERVVKLHIVSEKTLPNSLELPGTLREQIEGGEALVSLDRFEPALAGELGKRYDARIEVRRLNLEDIFTELHYAP